MQNAFCKIQLVSKCYTVVSYKAVFRLYIYKTSVVYLPEYMVTFKCKIQGLRSLTINLNLTVPEFIAHFNLFLKLPDGFQSWVDLPIWIMVGQILSLSCILSVVYTLLPFSGEIVWHVHIMVHWSLNYNSASLIIIMTSLKSLLTFERP